MKKLIILLLTIFLINNWNSGFAFTLEQTVIKSGSLFDEKKIVKLSLTVSNEQKQISYYFEEPEGTTSVKNNSGLLPRESLLTNNLEFELRWLDDSESSKVQFDLSTDKVLTGILQELINENASEDDCELIITTFFSESVYSKNKKYKKIYERTLAREKKLEDIENTKLKNKEQQENLRQSLISLYEQIKNHKILKLNGTLSADEEAILSEAMIADNYGQKVIPDNANSIQSEKILKENINIKEQTFKSYIDFIQKSIMTSNFKFNTMTKVYVVKKNSYNKVMTKAKEFSKRNFIDQNVYYTIPPNLRDKSVKAYAEQLIKKNPLDFGEETDYNITYSIPVNKDNSETSNNTNIFIINIPGSFIENYEYGINFHIEGNPKVIRDNDNKDLYTFDKDKYKYILVFDFTKVKKFEKINK